MKPCGTCPGCTEDRLPECDLAAWERVRWDPVLRDLFRLLYREEAWR